MKKCLLCHQVVTNSVKSHIIPKFIGKELLTDNKMLILSKQDQAFYSSDLPKREGIFCVDCEKKIGTVETISSRILNDLKLNNYKDFSLSDKSTFRVVFEMINNTEKFNLFLLSIIWRISISDEYLFKSIKLSGKVENCIRKILNYNLKPNINDYNTFDKYTTYSNYILLFQRPTNVSINSRGVISLSNPSEGIYIFNFPFFQISLMEGDIFPKLSKADSFNSKLSQLHIIVNPDFIFREESFNSLSNMKFSERTINKILKK